MKRAKLTNQLIQELCAGTERQAFIESVHHGLAEVPLSGIYAHLNLDEVLTFAAASWQLRNSSFFRTRKLGRDAPTIYAIFQEAYQHEIILNGLQSSSQFRNVHHWYNTQKKISPKWNPLYEQLNPFNPTELSDRLKNISPEAAINLKERVVQPPLQWIFECQYDERKRMQGGDNHNLRIMTFQLVFPKRGKIIPKYAEEIGRIMKSYPQEYELRNKPTQLELL